MFSLGIEANGQTVWLTHNQDFSVVKVSGLTPPQQHINLSSSGLADGADFNSAVLDVRNIVVTLYLNGKVEENRKRIYSIFPMKSPCIIFFLNTNRKVKIQGYVELIDSDLFTPRELVQVSLICPQPYWEDLQKIRAELSRSIAGFEFPFSISSAGTVLSGGSAYPVADIQNSGDTSVGFVTRITVTDADPELTLTEHTSNTPASIMGRRVLFPIGQDFDYDPDTQELDIYVNANLHSSGYTTDFLLFSDTSEKMRVVFSAATLTAGDSVRADVYTWETVQVQQEAEHILYPADFVADVCHVPKPDWYDRASGKSIILYQRIIPEVPVDLSEYSVDDTGSDIAVTYVGSWGTSLRLAITGTTEEQQKDIACTETVIVSAPAEVFYSVFSYTADDLLRVYMDGQKLTDWSIETVEVSDGSQQLCFHLGTPMTGRVTVQVISSISGEDVSGYTDTQVDDGLLLVDNLAVSSDSGGKLTLSGMQFRPHDVIDVSTVSGDIYVKCVSSDWITPGKNLLSAVSPDSSFPKLRPGENRISLTSSTCQELLSGEISAKKLYGGV